MTASVPDPRPAAPDWEAFYRDYRKPGYVAGFELIGKLGGGMFGLVFRARKQSIGKDYAIKFLKVEDPMVARAVLAELEQVQYFAQIDHPNLVSIEDRGEVDGIPYLVMAFAGTETLRDKLRSDGRPPAPAERDELLRWFLQACRGAAALHDRGLVHFDIKPANVFLKGAVARLGDYGLSKLVTESRGSLSTGRGTPYYMAPELLQRRGDHRSDIYSFGVLLYEILCGQVPFRGDSEWEVLKKHELEPPELPPHLAAADRAVLQRCLQKDPAARFQSVHDLIVALGAPVGVAAAAAQAAPPQPPPVGEVPPCLPPHAAAPPPGPRVHAPRRGPFPPPLPRQHRRRSKVWGVVILGICAWFAVTAFRSAKLGRVSIAAGSSSVAPMVPMARVETDAVWIDTPSPTVPTWPLPPQAVLDELAMRAERQLAVALSNVQVAERTQRRITLRELDRGLQQLPEVRVVLDQVDLVAAQDGLSPAIAARFERQARAAVLAAASRLQLLDFRAEDDCHRGARLLELLGKLTAVHGLETPAPTGKPSKAVTARFAAAADGWRLLAERCAASEDDFAALLRATGKVPAAKAGNPR